MVTVLNQAALRRFKRRAREHFPKEYMEAVVGFEKDGVFFVVDLETIALKQAKGWVDFVDAEEVEDIHEEAREDGLEWLGTCHTHPNCDPVPSDADLIGARGMNERLIGIYEISEVKDKKLKKRFRTKLQWWPAHYPLSVVNP